jgi:hypothetical protein
MKITDYNIDNTIIERDATTDEIDSINKVITAYNSEQLERTQAKASAEAKLEVLGLTADDLKALGL